MKIFICVSVVICLIVSLFNRNKDFSRKEKTVLAMLTGVAIGMGICIVTELFVVPFLHLETERVVVETRYLKAIKDNEDVEGVLRRGIFVTRGYIDERFKYVVMEGNNEQGYKLNEYDPTLVYLHEINENNPRVEVTYKDFKNELARELFFKANSNYEYHIYVPEGSICDEYDIDLE